ncbi:hydrogenase/urease accessory protein [Pseudomonas sp. GM21]|uniref:HupE/UreJ family protein n=1 Tax=Pseudomonas sp. GM21 TaxID=1144325 RepID=UPI0002722F27|nr:HupE/UreJ family protein [Pseudomonas sp. GM21]EJM21086.1 hydrogenase/urease accessory protein [Pseudomonas sp. GM21]
MRLLTKLFSAAVLFVPAVAFAHPGHDASGALAGLSHPLTGLDHLLAMLAVGLWASQQKGNLRWALPVTFVAMMLVGGWLGFEGLNIPYLETGIATSVLALGLLVSVALRPPVGLAVAMTALFAMAHGVAHGLELPTQASPWSYATGFVCATSALHALGYAAARALPQAAAPLVRLAGMLSAAAGVWLLAGA